jgi:hypothetical protein
MRIRNEKLSMKFEDWADFIFLAGLVITLILTILVATDVLLFTK